MNFDSSDKLDQDQRRDTTRPNQRYCQTVHAAVCLERVLAYHGVPCPREKISERLSASPCDEDVINFLDVAEFYGVVGKPTLLKTSEWHTVKPVSILHWGSAGLVVFESFEEESVLILDPVLGQRFVDMAEFRRRFSGLALQFEARMSAKS